MEDNKNNNVDNIKSSNKKSMTIVIVVALILILVASIVAVVLSIGNDGNPSEEFEFKNQSGKAIITKYVGKEKEVVIPSSLKGKKIAGFDIGAFSGSDVETITFSKKYSGDIISEGAFKEASKLKSITLPSSITTIGIEAFSKCTQLVTVNFNDNITMIDERAFYGCSAFQKSNSTAELANVVLPAKLALIEAQAFYQCSAIEKMTVGDALTEIGESAFEGCSKLADFVVSSTNIIKNIGKKAFEATNLKSIKKTEGSVVDTALTFPKLENIGERAFYALKGARNFEYFKIPATVKYIGDYAFGNNIATKQIEFSEGISLTSLGKGAFSDLTYLEDITLPQNLTKIPDLLFSGCYRLLNTKSFTIGDNVTSIGEGAFALYNCLNTDTSGRNNYTNYELTVSPNNANFSITQLADYYTKEGSAKKHFALIDNANKKFLAYIGGFTSDCSTNKPDSGDASIVLNHAFDYLNTQLRDTVVQIGGYAFAGMQIERVVMSPSINFIGNYAFSNGKINSIVAHNRDCETVQDNAFSNLAKGFRIIVNSTEDIEGGTLYKNVIALEEKGVLKDGDVNFYRYAD